MLELIEIKKPKKRLKIGNIFALFLAAIVISLVASYFGVVYGKCSDLFKEERGIVDEENEFIKEQILVEENIINQVEQIKQEDENKNFDSLTEEQYNNILNIYQSNGTKRVFLTFDDGPTQTVTPLILDILKEENIKATFFVLGYRAKNNPELLKRMYEEGHYIANHGYSHNYNNIYSSEQAVLDEYIMTEQIIKDGLENQNYNSRVFRFPGGSAGGKHAELKANAIQLLKENNIAFLNWNALSSDAAGAKTREKIIESVINTSDGKDTVVLLMHDAADKILTYDTLRDVIGYYRVNGYEFCNLYDVI